MLYALAAVVCGGAAVALLHKALFWYIDRNGCL